MKYVIILCDGMADYPVKSLDGKTPLSVAKKPMMDHLASLSEVGLVKTVPDGLAPGSDLAMTQGSATLGAVLLRPCQ